MKNMKTKLIYEFEFEMDILSYKPDRPAPACQNHDSPAFSDSGDDEFLEFDLFLRDEKENRVEIKDEIIYEKVYQAALDEARDLFADKYYMEDDR